MNNMECNEQGNAYFEFKNMGANTITSLTYTYSVNNGPAHTETWYGNMPSLTTETIQIPDFNLNLNANNTVIVQVTAINGVNMNLDPKSVTIKKNVSSGSGEMTFTVATDAYASETTFKFFDPNGNVVLSGGPWENLTAAGTTTHVFTFNPQVDGCYRLEVYDAYGDGINSGFGAGYFTLVQNSDNTQILYDNGQFGSKATYMIGINPSTPPCTTVYNEFSENACVSYTWNGHTYTKSGDYTQTLTTENGCDSVVTLHLILVEMPVMQAITGEQEICINQYATYHYDISDPNYQYRWYKDNVLWAENVPVMTLHEMGEDIVIVTMQVADGQSGCAADTSLYVQVHNRIAPDTTEIRRKVNTNIPICQPVYSDYGQVHYRWGYTDLNTSDEVVIPGDRNYCLYEFGIDTLSYRYWVETYLDEAVGEGCANRSYYAHGYVTTSTPDYGGNVVEAYLSNDRIMLYVNSLSLENIMTSLYDVNGKLLLSKGYGTTDKVSDVIPVSIAPGVYFLRVSIGGQMYSVKLLKL